MIICLTGNPGNGKSFESVREFIVPALSKGRIVYTNIRGIDPEKIRVYVAQTQKVELEKVGQVVPFTDEDILRFDFFPAAGQPGFVQPGGFVVIDEAHNYYRSDTRSFGDDHPWRKVGIPDQHRRFFREHRHLVDDKGVSCDVLLITQDVSDLNRSLKVVVEFTYTCTKQKIFGASSKYRVNCYNGAKISPRTLLSRKMRHFDKRIFDLYQSYKGAGGNEDSVQDGYVFWKSRSFITMMLVILVAGGIGSYSIYSLFFKGGMGKKFGGVDAPQKSQVSASPSVPGAPIAQAPKDSPLPSLVGTIRVAGNSLMVVTYDHKNYQLLDASLTDSQGFRDRPSIDGRTIGFGETQSSGSSKGLAANLATPAPSAAAPIAAPAGVTK